MTVIHASGSDKCQGEMHLEGGLAGESECFTSLGPYMAMAEKIRELDPRVDTIVLTSEDQRYLNDRASYAKDGRWRFILNPADTAKGTGTLSVMAASAANHSMHDVFMSMFTSLHLQVRHLSSRFPIRTCMRNTCPVACTILTYALVQRTKQDPPHTHTHTHTHPPSPTPTHTHTHPHNTH